MSHRKKSSIVTYLFSAYFIPVYVSFIIAPPLVFVFLSPIFLSPIYPDQPPPYTPVTAKAGIVFPPAYYIYNTYISYP